MAESYIPTRDAEALAWLKNFANHLTNDPARYGFAPADAANIQAVVNAYEAAYDVVSNPATRNPGATAAKDEARNIAEQLCRQYAILIKYNAGITTQDKIDIGIRPVNPNRDPIGPPDSSPLINIIGATPGSHTLRYADSNTPDSPRKPFGVVQLQLFVAIADAEVTQPEEAQFYRAFTRNPIGVTFNAADDGKVATYFARWATRRGDVGPWSLAASMRIAA